MRAARYTHVESPVALRRQCARAPRRATRTASRANAYHGQRPFQFTRFFSRCALLPPFPFSQAALLPAPKGLAVPAHTLSPPTPGGAGGINCGIGIAWPGFIRSHTHQSAIAALRFLLSSHYVFIEYGIQKNLKSIQEYYNTYMYNHRSHCGINT